jgi:hypothetical protein
MESSIPGYVNYKRREYCKAIKCPNQIELDKYKEDSGEYEAIRVKCKNNCLHTTHEFHTWLIKEGFLLVKPFNRELY